MIEFPTEGPTSPDPASVEATAQRAHQRDRHPAMSEQELIKELFAAIRGVVHLYGSQNAAARALGVSSAMLTRASPAWVSNYSTNDRPPRPHRATLLTLAGCEHEQVRQFATALLARRG